MGVVVELLLLKSSSKRSSGSRITVVGKVVTLGSEVKEPVKVGVRVGVGAGKSQMRRRPNNGCRSIWSGCY